MPTLINIYIKNCKDCAVAKQIWSERTATHAAIKIVIGEDSKEELVE